MYHPRLNINSADNSGLSYVIISYPAKFSSRNYSAVCVSNHRKAAGSRPSRQYGSGGCNRAPQPMPLHRDPPPALCPIRQTLSWFKSNPPVSSPPSDGLPHPLPPTPSYSNTTEKSCRTKGCAFICRCPRCFCPPVQQVIMLWCPHPLQL